MKLSIISVAAAFVAFGSQAVLADNYANFFNDDNCSLNGGIGVDINNDGCLGQRGRGSVYIPRADDVTKKRCLIATYADGSCSCQTTGLTFTATGFCAKLDRRALSYRFIEEECGHSSAECFPSSRFAKWK